MAWGGRYLYRLLVRERGMDPHRIIVTDLDADYRVHPQYFAYLTWVHLTDPNRETQLYQPIPYFHNNLWDAPLLAAAVRRGADPAADVAQRAAGEAAELRVATRPRCNLVHEVGYWATDAIPEDSRFYWKSYFTLRRPLPRRPALHPDLRRRGARARLLAVAGRAVHCRHAAGRGA